MRGRDWAVVIAPREEPGSMGAMRWTEKAVVVVWVNPQDRSSNGGDEKRAVAMEDVDAVFFE